MKRYIVTEAELEEHVKARIWYEQMKCFGTIKQGKDAAAELKASEAACRSRPVPEWATHVTCGLLLHGDGENEVDRTEEIPE